MTEVQRRSKKNYRKKIEVVHIELYPTDQDIIDRLGERIQAGEPKTTYIKRLIREDIKSKAGK